MQIALRKSECIDINEIKVLQERLQENKKKIIRTNNRIENLEKERKSLTFRKDILKGEMSYLDKKCDNYKRKKLELEKIDDEIKKFDNSEKPEAARVARELVKKLEKEKEGILGGLDKYVILEAVEANSF
jgi:chromosome segregation ATPase